MYLGLGAACMSGDGRYLAVLCSCAFLLANRIWRHNAGRSWPEITERTLCRQENIHSHVRQGAKFIALQTIFENANLPFGAE